MSNYPSVLPKRQYVIMNITMLYIVFFRKNLIVKDIK